ncbi:MAG TPA: phosphatase PAP2 family protein [Ilumatobacteraceae bacterium]|jgi:membrane-associated phospholipid phosphatase|nr:phosphatase PAP2 family protein [Ilumatobacteraceae bacterium]
MVVLIVVGAGAAVAGFVALLARRWPVIEAPSVSGQTLTAEVDKHPKLADHLRRHFNPKTETGIALSVATSVVLAAGVGIGLVVAMIRSKSGLSSFDLRFARYGAQHSTSWSTSAMRAISQLGGTSGVVTLAVIATVVEYVRRPSRAVPLFMTLVVAGQFALSNGIKYIVDRARPDLGRLTGFAGSSFPSGHATAASATLAAIALIATRNRSRRTKIAGASIAAGAAVLVAGTRVFLGVHWFTDVIAGLLLGWGWFALCSIAFGGRLLTFGVPVAEAEQIADATLVSPWPTTGRRSLV